MQSSVNNKIMNNLKFLLSFFLIFVSLNIYSQQAPIFTTPTLISGVDKQVGARYRYSNVTTVNGTSVDAILTIFAINSATVVDVDNPFNGGLINRFQPVINSLSAGGNVEFEFSFYVAGTYNTSTPLQIALEQLTIEALDIDGTEFFDVRRPNNENYAIEANSFLTVQNINPFTRFQGPSNSVDPISVANTRYIAAVFYSNINTLRFRLGNANVSSNRQSSISFGEVTFNVPKPPIANNDSSLCNNPGVVSLNVTTNDVDPNSNINVSTVDLNQSVSGIQNSLVVSGQGVWTVNTQGVVTFTPASGFTGNPTPISYTINDTTSLISNQALITIKYKPATPVVLITQTTCAVSTGTITVSSPTGSGLSYSINGSTYTNTTGIFNSVAPGTYSVTVRNSDGCISTATSATINPQPVTPASPTLTVINNCDGTSTLTASNYTGTLLWSTGASTPSITVNSAGTYTATQTASNGCTSAPSSVVAMPKTAPIVTSSQTNICAGTSFVLNGNNNSGIWTQNSGNPVGANLGTSSNGNATVTFADSATIGTYNFTFTSNGCTAMTSIQLRGCSDLNIIKTNNNQNPIIGTNVTFTVVAENLGQSIARDVVVTDVLPSGYTLVSANVSAGTVSGSTWTIGNLNVGASLTLTIVATVKSTGNYANTATITGSNFDVNLNNNSSTSTPSPVNAIINANNDSAGPINGISGLNNVLNVFTNDTLNGTAPTNSSVILTTVTPNQYLVLNANGSVNVLPGTPNGVYSLTYQICETVNPTNCATAIVTISVNDGNIPCNTPDVMPFTSAVFDNLNVTTSTSGLCVLGCGISNSSRLIDNNLTNFATASTSIGVGVTHNLRVTDGNTTYPAGTFAGYRIAPNGGLLSADLLNSVTIRTFLNGAIKETFSGSSLVNVSLLGNAGSYVIGFNTNQTFDAIEISLNSLVGALTSTNIFYPVISTYCAGPALDCNVPTAMNYPAFPTTIQYTHTGLSGVSVGSVSNAENVISASSSDFASLNLLVGVLGSASLAVKDQVTDYPAGTYAGFEIENTNLVSVSALGNIQIKTYLNGVLKEQFSGSNLLVNGTLLNTTGRYKIGFVSTQAFDEVQISINQTVGINLGTTRVYNAVFEKFCAGPDLPCNTAFAPTAPTYPVFINGVNTGIDGLVCALCNVSATENLIDTNATNFAQINLTASVGTSGKIAVKDQITDYPAGTFAGYEIENLSLLNVNAFDAITITTYLNGVQRESKSGNSALISLNTNLLNGNGRQTIGFVSTLAFDEVQIKLTNLVSVNLGTTKVYNAVFQKFCPTTVSCNTTYQLTNPTFPVVINGANSGISGVACVACAVSNTNNVLTANTADFANISITAGVLASGSIAVADQLFTYPAGTYAGFTIRDLNGLIELNLFNSLSISTYNNGVLQETRGGSQLLNLSALGIIYINQTAGIYNVGFKATLPFDEIRIRVGSLASVINNINVFGAFVNTKDSNDGGTGSLSCASSDLSIVKTVNNATPFVGSTVTFTILASNAGPTDATNVVVNDILPSGYTLSNSSASTGTYNSTSGVWTIGNLNSGANATLTITCIVKATGNYANTAVISGSQPDPNLNNNTSTSTPLPVNVIDAVNDAGAPIIGATGGQSVPNVLVNDTLNGNPATLATVTLTQVSTTNPGVTLNTADGSVNVAPGTPSGSYVVTYQICEILNPNNCDTATVTVVVNNAVIDAVNDAGAPIIGATGGQSVPKCIGK